ncbi:MAG: hypothetical protein OH319_01850 [Candidatus Parvarchaeota archaeon]|nr:hypothetical protein [Candidatus Jingweiarchaeum tengchongense]MCW1298113.1 hypothetical protein [Candidatus Jingweiarchaeum tengchongense]MCW1299913.1 hypothetical protein [Candidatus Jingweiarchaeum tengchongense]MCW1305134.1 hypothetical protein [Candidatus Jingweiarchaeum tengchongense]MCW1305535.1 hypothetical protein [Candidatus Jingweiarchaeum tengchongense]
MRKLILIVFLSMLFSVALAQPLITVQTSVQPSSSLSAGQEGLFNVIIANAGNAIAKNLNVTIYDSEINKYNLISLGDLGISSSQTATFKFNIPSNMSAGIYKTRLNVSYMWNDTLYSLERFIYVTVIPNIIFQVRDYTSTPEDFGIGDLVDIKLGIANVGSDAAKDVVITWAKNSSTFVPIGGNSLYMSEFEGKITRYIYIKLFVSKNIQPGVYPLDITITYKDSTGAQYTTNHVVGLKVSTKSKIDVSLDSFSPQFPVQGGKLEMSIRVTNLGPNDVESLAVRIEPPEKFRIVGSDEVYIGSLKSDDFDTAVFNFNTDRTVEPGTYKFLIQVKYRDFYNNEYTQNKTISLRIYSQTQVPVQVPTRGVYSFITPTNILIIVLIIIIILLYRKMSKKK